MTAKIRKGREEGVGREGKKKAMKKVKMLGENRKSVIWHKNSRTEKSRDRRTGQREA